MSLVDPAIEQAPTIVDARVPGEVLDGRYRLVYRIGRGGFGDVWRAEELLPDGAPFREVALKLLLAPSSDTTHWAEEAKLLASFRHPSLVTIYAAGIFNTEPPLRFVAMELLEGQNLQDLLRERGPIPWRRVLRWACSAAAALDVIHLGGVVHLDLKPANLFLGSDGALKVLDFGIARRAGTRSDRRRHRARSAGIDALATALGTAPVRVQQEAEAPASTVSMFAATRPMAGPLGTADQTAPRALSLPTFIDVDRVRGTATLAPDDSDGQVVIGTPGFMAPEVLDLVDPTAAADAYALAVCVVQLITGHLPQAAADEPAAWDDPTAVSEWLDAIRWATLRGELRDFAADPAVCPRGLAASLYRLFAVDPRERGVTAGKLGELFEEVWQRPRGVPDPPYLGFAAFPAEAEGVLFGRDDDISRLGRELEFEPAVVLQGVRGGGKSSLASAGLVPYLGLRGTDGKDDWTAVRVIPGADPDAALARALAAVSPALQDASAADLVAHCDASPIGLVLLVDPLEEALVAPPGQRARLSALMAALAERPISPGLRLIAALAEEHTAALLATVPLGASLRASLRFVGAPSIAAVADIVAGPAHFAGVSVVGIDAVVAEVQRELRASAFRLPYVALALRAFWDAGSGVDRSNAPPAASGPSRTLHGDRFRDLGGVRGVLVRHAERVIVELGLEERAIATELLLRLSATDGAPLRWSEPELLATIGEGEAHALAERVLDVLMRAHLVLRHGGSVEIGHEALLTSFPRLTSARLHQMDRLLFLERVREAAQAWERADNHRDFLLHGALLEELRGRFGPSLSGLSPRERGFIEQSLRRERWRRLKRVAFGVVTLLVLASAVVGGWKIDAARDAEARTKSAAIELERTAELAAKSRRTDNPYWRTAYIVAAMERGSPDGMLPLDLAGLAAGLSRADLLTLDHVAGASFDWDDRWAVGKSSDDTLIVVDFRPPESDVIDDIDIDIDPELAATAHFRMPAITEIRPHADAIIERVPFAFDTSFVTRSVTGEVKVIRLRRDGTQVIAATGPFRCAGAVQLAEAAPVLACATEEGIVRWDLRKARPDPTAPEAVAHHRFAGAVAAVSADGARVAANLGNRVLLWAPDEGREAVYTANETVALARWSPRDEALAVIDQRGFAVVDFGPIQAKASSGDAAAITAPLVRGSTPGLPTSVRWDEGGVDLGICEANNVGRWFSLKSGGRSKEDPAPQGSPCAPPRPTGQPEPLGAAASFDELAGKDLGPYYSPLGGFKLKAHRYLTPGLVLLNAAAPAAEPLLRFRGRDEIGSEEERKASASVVAVERDSGAVVVQMQSELHFYMLPQGYRLFVRPGNLLRRCSDGRLVAWLAVEGAFHVIDAWTGELRGVARREPGIVVGADSACKVLYTQRLDGTLMENTLASEGAGAARPLVVADGYIYDARPSPARGSVGPGTWLALSSGAIARIDEQRGAVRLLGYASPRASVIAEGSHPGEVAYVDSTGVILKDLSGKAERILEATGESPWEDLSVAPDGASMLLSSADRITALDLGRREIVGWIPVDGKGRLSRWDDDGSVIAWSFDREGGAEGQVIPRGVPLAKQIAAAVSNLAVDRGRLVVRR